MRWGPFRSALDADGLRGSGWIRWVLVLLATSVFGVRGLWKVGGAGALGYASVVVGSVLALVLIGATFRRAYQRVDRRERR